MRALLLLRPLAAAAAGEQYWHWLGGFSWPLAPTCLLLLLLVHDEVLASDHALELVLPVHHPQVAQAQRQEPAERGQLKGARHAGQRLHAGASSNIKGTRQCRGTGPAGPVMRAGWQGRCLGSCPDRTQSKAWRQADR